MMRSFILGVIVGYALRGLHPYSRKRKDAPQQKVAAPPPIRPKPEQQGRG